MRIQGLRTVVYEYPTARPIGDVQLPGGARRMAETAVFLTTDEEPVGLAIASSGAAPILHDLAAELVGRDPRAVRSLHEMLLRRTFKAGQGGAVGSAVAALDIALWDLRAKQNGVPLWRELGASSGRVPVYASGLDMPLPDDELGAFYLGMAKDHGISAGKLKVGRDPERDLQRLAIMRDALAEGSSTARPSLMIDSNEFWTPKQAIRRISEIEREFELVWAEEPARRDDHRGLARVSRAVQTAVATGENLTMPGQFVPLLIHESADVLQVSVEGTGITTALKIFDMADAFGIPVAVMNGPGRLAAHVGAALSNHLAMEVLGPPADAVFTTDHRLEDGCIVLSEAPGLGLTFDEDLLSEHAVDHPSSESLSGNYRRAPDSGISESGMRYRDSATTS